MQTNDADRVLIPPHWSSKLLNQASLSSLQTFFNSDKTLTVEFTPHDAAEGPKGHVHGGYLATILDETMGGTSWYNGLAGLAANLNVRYRKSVPLGASYKSTGCVTRLDKRRAYLSARIYDDKTLYCEATAVFVRVPLDFLRREPEMAHAVRIIDYIESGMTIAELVKMDADRHQRA